MIDSHAHVAFRQFNDDRDAVVERARAKAVRWLEVGTDLAQSHAAIALAEQYSDVVLGAAVGVHPSDAAALTEEIWREIEGMSAQQSVAAIGEVGLDYFRGGTRTQQLPVLERFVQLAIQRQLPVIFHVRDGQASAHDDLLEFLSELPPAARPGGVIHTFSGNREQAQRYLELGMHLSFSGVVTYKNAAETAAVAAEAPLDRLLIETDCPFLTPDPHRGQRNEPVYVELVAERIAALRGAAVAQIAETSAQNAERLFRRG